jgi:hypothetical protein
MMTRLMLGTLLLCHGAAQAGPPPLAPNDFAFGYEILLQDSAAIYRLPLPPEVYRRAVHSDLSDLRVFNAAGEPVPHLLRRRPQHTSAQETSAELSFFPLPEPAGDPGRPLSVEVTRDARGAVVRGEEDATVVSEDRPGAYLVDTSQLDRPPDVLELAWTTPHANFIAEIGVAGSDDLVNWRPLVAEASVARLYFAGRVLERKRIEVPRKAFRYLRLDWPAQIGAVRLAAVTAWFGEPLPEVRRGWEELAGAPEEEGRPVFDYELASHVPVDRVGLWLPPGNALIAASISSRDADGDWRLRHRGSFYRVEVDGAAMAKEDAAIAKTRAPYWRIELEGNSGTLTVPLLRLGWVLDDLYFLARGEGPFTLAYGAVDAPPQATGVDEVVARIDEKNRETLVGNAEPGEALELGGEAKLTPAPLPLPWQQIVLWSALVLGVVGVGAMAWRLGRRMQRDKPPDSHHPGA